MNYDGLICCAALLGIACFLIGQRIERRKQERKAQGIARINERYRPARDR